MKEHIDVLIVGSHQTYLNTYAGGYIRLREFLKRFPKSLSYKIIDNEPTIYGDLVPSTRIEMYDLPRWLKTISSISFILRVLIERIHTGFALYSTAEKIIKDNQVKLLYVPIGEFLQLYLPAVQLKRKYPHLKLIVDILNFEIVDTKNFWSYYQKQRNNKLSVINAFLVTLLTYISFSVVKKTISPIDYIFTVSPELVQTIGKVYKKDTIDFTPSGVNNNFPLPTSHIKKYSGLYLGRVTAQKGVFDLLTTWQLVTKAHPEAQLAIAGAVNDDVLAVIKNTLKSLHIENNVTILGSVTEEEKQTILAESEIFVHLARYEPLFPVIGILEGLSYGQPAVLFDMEVIASQKEMYQEKSLFIVENGDTAAAAKKIGEILSLPDTERKKLAEKAKQFAGKYDWDAIADKEFSVISQLIK